MLMFNESLGLWFRVDRWCSQRSCVRHRGRVFWYSIHRSLSSFLSYSSWDGGCSDIQRLELSLFLLLENWALCRMSYTWEALCQCKAVTTLMKKHIGSSWGGLSCCVILMAAWLKHCIASCVWFLGIVIKRHCCCCSSCAACCWCTDWWLDGSGQCADNLHHNFNVCPTLKLNLTSRVAGAWIDATSALGSWR